LADVTKHIAGSLHVQCIWHLTSAAPLPLHSTLCPHCPVIQL